MPKSPVDAKNWPIIKQIPTQPTANVSRLRFPTSKRPTQPKSAT